MDSFLIEEGTSGETLVLATGEQIQGEDLRSIVREAAAFRANLARLALRAPRNILEQSALSGVFADNAGQAEAEPGR